ncbi:MAG: PQQ-binding-like beta-propeller repeat protein, partial [Acidimicrobiia bacterium]
MTIDWDIEPVTSSPPVPRRPGSTTNRERSWPKLPSRRTLIVAGAVGLAALVSVAGLGAIGASDSTRVSRATGSPIGRKGPLEPRQPKYLASVWSHDLIADPTALLVDGEDAFVVGPYQVTDLDPTTGTERWQTEVENAEPFIAANQTTVLVAATDGFEALDSRSGASRWKIELDSAKDWGRTVGLAHVGGAEVAVVASKLGGVVGINGVTGETIWSVHVDGEPRGRWAVDDRSGTAALESTDGEHVTLRVFDVASGQVRWTASLGRDTGVPVYVGDLLILGTGRTDEGSVRAYTVADGTQVWETRMTAS